MKLAPDKYLEKIANANESNIEGFDKMIYDGYVYRSCDTITKHIKFVGEYRIYLTMIYSFYSLSILIRIETINVRNPFFTFCKLFILYPF